MFPSASLTFCMVHNSALHIDVLWKLPTHRLVLMTELQAYHSGGQTGNSTGSSVKLP